MKSLRYAAFLLVAAAGVATATAPKPEDPVKKSTVLSEGTSPTPLCYGRICR